eukprot:TRINITY_DN16583_c0_g1_i1.p1 TRINITY_DN16583_c0_g1~~TRINITY_DN16583_c0_g1_i1.p1  ORF type:complete len:333 (+),score=62.40 TRINITY_DN16583_c0_g1_i1:71-1069(+)
MQFHSPRRDTLLERVGGASPEPGLDEDAWAETRSRSGSNGAKKQVQVATKINWKILLVGLIVIYQLVGIFFISTADDGDTWGRIAQQQEGDEEVLLSPPVAPDIYTEVPTKPVDPGARKEPRKRVKKPEEKANVTKAENKTAVDKVAAVPKPVGVTTKKVRRQPDERTVRCSPLAGFFGYLGGAAALGLSCMGAGIGIAKSGVAMAHLAMDNKPAALRGMLPVIMSELLSIYGLITGVTITLSVASYKHTYPLSAGLAHLCSGIAVGGSCLISGSLIGTVGAACNHTLTSTPAVFTAMVLMLIFSEALALYGVIGGMLMNTTANAIAVGNRC